MSHLIPESRVNKLGHAVTKHVRPAAIASAVSSIPAPALEAAVSKPVRAYKPTRIQMMERRYIGVGRRHETDLALADAAGVRFTYEGRYNYDFSATDVEVYSVYSAVSGDSKSNAVALLAAGVRSKEAASEFLSENYLDRLAEDRSELTDKLLRQKVPSAVFLDFVSTHRITDAEPQHIADAADLYTVRGFANVRVTPSVFERALRGDFTADDLKTIGAGRLKKSSAPEAILDALSDIKKGTVTHSAMELRYVLDDMSIDLLHSETLELVKNFGAGFVGSTQKVERAYRMFKELQNYDFSNYEQKLIMHYNSLFEIYRGNRNDITRAEVITLYQNKVDAKAAAQQISSGGTIQQVLGVHVEGITPSVADGWL